MSIITKIEEQKNKSRVNIFVDGAFFCGLQKETAVIFGLKTGKEIDEKTLDSAVKQSEEKRAFEKGADLLAGRMHSKNELVQKLIKKGFSAECSEKAVAKLEEYSYIDDRAFAKAFVQTNSNFSKKVLKEKLRAKGVDINIIDETLREISSDDEFVSCLKLAEKYAKSHNVSDFKGKQNLFASLARRGFGFDTIKLVVKKVTDCDDLESFE